MALSSSGGEVVALTTAGGGTRRRAELAGVFRTRPSEHGFEHGLHGEHECDSANSLAGPTRGADAAEGERGGGTVTRSSGELSPSKESKRERGKTVLRRASPRRKAPGRLKHSGKAVERRRRAEL